jgi:hypothetical protein
VPLDWVIDPEERCAEIWRSEDDLPGVVRDALVWRPPGSEAPFVLRFSDLFRPI